MLPISKRIIIFDSLILSNILYGIEIYAKCGTTKINMLQKAQNRLLKILYNQKKLTRTNIIHKEYDVLKISDQYKLRTLLISHKVVHFPNERNIAHNEIIRINHGRNLRNNLNLIATTESYSRKNKISENVSILWNSLLNDKKTICNRDKFKKEIKSLFLNDYN
jgi:hypothetical protein